MKKAQVPASAGIRSVWRSAVGRVLLPCAAMIMLAAVTVPAHADTPPPPGANNWSCRPSYQHPRPVVLVHGTAENMADNWSALSPALTALGYCVYALNYGANAYSNGVLYGLGPIEASAGELSTFVDKVLNSSGATQVDVVGHSQGGMMPRYYLKFLGGAYKVRTLIGLAPSNHGTTVNGITTLVRQLPAFQQEAQQVQKTVEQLVATGCPACTQQFAGSDFLNRLNAGGDTVYGVKYTVVVTSHDEVVTPYASAFLSGSGVANITLQNQCAFDPVEHLGISYDPIAIHNVINALDPAHAYLAPSCFG
jgi:triacylglycerol esterase/lipase EstA (alpha/beta hydrolase family)